MNQIGPGFEAFRRTCERHSIAANFGPRRTRVPKTVLGQPLEPTLRALYREHDGVWWSAPEFSLRVYPLEGPDALESNNAGLRRSGGDYVPPYPFEDLLAFAQYGRQASYLATVPSLADDAGRQPVLYLDTHEDPWAVPVASTADRAFELLSLYIEEAIKRLGRAGLTEIVFPLDVPDLISADAVLSAMVASKAFEVWTRGDQSIRKWIQNTFKRV
jgi:hypothetical protein